MPELSTTHLSSPVNTKKIVFHTSPKMSTYLLAWAVGEFDFVQGTTKGGVSIRVFSPPGRAEQGLFALDVGIRSLDFYDSFFKVTLLSNNYNKPFYLQGTISSSEIGYDLHY